ncbi:hypothetical protein EJ04DRAFT_486485 [Polyplosphaeria fusca]|uniref:Anaphase-promoting complex subunit 1 n=1 Tax=Polyplosphaeria fusca TaxID=682080 RepID=A0A9P4R504_9PLEO|nr:hypothetical protein EJ04DRAFT_486485 [Polyplosphaeria fusca]
MASLRSLGTHRPAALRYLIDESILDQDCTEADYSWETYNNEGIDCPSDDVVTTQYHVVWSRGDLVRKVFSFNIEQEKVIQALLTWFPTEEPLSSAATSTSAAGFGNHDLSTTFLTQGTQPATDPDGSIPQTPRVVEGRAQALVVFLKSQAHVFFLSGATHVINLPFEVEKAFPAARGVVLQRRIPQADPLARSPQLPSAPPNSFLSDPQSFLTQSLSQSFAQLGRNPGFSRGPSSQFKSHKNGNTQFLEELLKHSASTPADRLPRLFSFTNPLSELGLVVTAVSGADKGNLFNANGSGHRRLEPINKTEEIIYVSPQNELLFDESGNDKPMLLVITANSETNVFTIWSAAYLEPKSLSNSRKHHATQLGSKPRRRSSYGPTAPGTGATTPALRGNDRVRESLGGAGRTKPQPPSFNAPSQSQERLSDQAVEDALASQLNPETSRVPKESRRVSSLLSRAELSTSFDKTAFQDLATQRTSLGGSFNASFGASQRSRLSVGNDRTSFGGFSQRNRASTPGSVTSRMSLGGVSVDDTLEDIMDEDTFDTIEDYDELDDLFSPHDPDLIQEPMNGLRKEFVMSPVAEISAQKYLKTGLFSLRDSETSKATKVFALTAPFNSAMLHERKIFIYILHDALQHPLECELAVTRKRLSVTASQTRLSASAPRYACVPKFVKIKELKDSLDILKLNAGHVERLVSLVSTDPREPCLSIIAGWSIQSPARFALGTLKLFNPHVIFRDDDHMRTTAGLKRTVSALPPLQGVISPGPLGAFDLVDGESRRHRIQVDLVPKHPFVARLFQVLSKVLSNFTGDFLLEIWWSIRRTYPELDQQVNPDWTAFVATLFSLAVPFFEDRSTKPKRGKATQKGSSGRSSAQADLKADPLADLSAWDVMCRRQEIRPNRKSLDSTAWAWVQRSRPSPVTVSPQTRRLSDRQTLPIAEQIRGKNDMLHVCLQLARSFVQSPIGKATNDHWRRLSPSERQDLRITCLSEVVVILHLFREERKLNALSPDFSTSEPGNLAPVLAQIGHWLRWESWGWRHGSYYELDGGSNEIWAYDDSKINPNLRLHSQPWEAPPPILEWLGTVLRTRTYVPYPTLAMLIRKSKASPHSSVNIEEVIGSVTPRTIALHKFFQEIHELPNPRKTVELIERCGITTRILATLPQTARAPLLEAIARCQANPPTTWSSSLLRLVQREDLDLSLTPNTDFILDVQQNQSNTMTGIQSNLYYSGASRDIHTMCQGVDRPEQIQSVAEVERHYITRLIFREDRRFMETYTLLEPLKQAVAEYRPPPRTGGIDTDEAAILDAQKALMQWVMVRTFSLPVGSSMVKFSSKKPLVTEKYPLFGFSTSCLMKPLGNVVTAERGNYSEEKYFWAFFNAGVAAGLSVARDAQGIDTSWIMYNKPTDLTNKHAGLLLGLGLNGHLKTIAKWLSFKYLTPKHTMTSVGLLLGLSASYMGTMDTLVTRLLSVHVTRMLPLGAAELNLSPYTQTTGLMGIGLLYYNTQHRRMSEVMLSEIEHVDDPDPSEPPDTLRDEAYRLAAGFALGFINLGKGKDLRGLHDMRIVERLMAVAVAPKPVDIVHLLDQATAGAVIAIALIFMKTNDEAVARRVDVPDTLPQFDYVRPDIFLLRSMAKHIIMWDSIRADDRWMKSNLPVEYRKESSLQTIEKLSSDQMPFFNITAGLLWSISLRYAGTGDLKVRDFLLSYLDQFMRINRIPALRFDAKLSRNTVRNCQDLVALSAATVMAGTGDLEVMRRLRGLHGRVGPDTPYGSHLAAHMAFGTLFIAGGTQTFSTSNKAIAALICAFYPLFPSDVQDSKAHLQAFRHFWVLATERRCLIVRDVDTGRAVNMSVCVHLKDGTQKRILAPGLVPEVQTIDRIETEDPAYWPAVLDLVRNDLHRKSFADTQTLHVRRRSAHDMFTSTFSATATALNDVQSSKTARNMWDWIFALRALQDFDRADIGLILPADPYSSSFLDSGTTVVDETLVLRALGRSAKAKDLWEVKGVLEWAEGVAATSGQGGRLRWVGREVLERIRAGLVDRGRRIEG